MCRILLSSMKVQIKNSLSRSMFRFCLFLNPVLSTFLLYQIFKNGSQNNYIQHIVIGAGLMGLWGCICFSSAGDIQRERWFKTLSAIYVSPTSFDISMLGRVMGNTILSLLSFIISYIVAMLLYQKWILIKAPLLFLFSLLICIVSFTIISLILSYLLMLSRKTSLYQNLIEMPIILICGFVFPIEILPRFVQYISYCLSPTWVVKLLNICMSNKIDMKEYFTYLIIITIHLIIQISIILLLKKIIDKQIRINATLEVS